MSQWDYFTDDIDDIENDNNIQLPVPESTQDYLVDDFSQFSYQDSFFQNSNFDFDNYAASAPDNRYFGYYENHGAKYGLNGNTKLSYCSVQYHPNRINVNSYKANELDLHVGDYVIIDADRGTDIGMVLELIDAPSIRDIKASRQIIRKANESEIDKLPEKQEMEVNALKICQMKVKELNLPMEITGAEYQYDGKKLTFYYSATQYIDFRNLVRILFKIFSTRIWMVWHDGNAPVKDVLTKNETEK